MPLTVRFSHYPSHTPLMELEMEPTTTVGTMKAMVEERLAGDEEGLPRVIANKWLLEIRIHSDEGLRMIVLEDSDDMETLVEAGIEDLSTIYLKGPTTDTSEGVGMSLSVLSSRITQIQRQQAEANSRQLLAMKELSDTMAHLADNQKQLTIELNRLRENQEQMVADRQRAVALRVSNQLNTEESADRALITEEEVRTRDNFSIALAMDKLATRHPKDRPLLTYWDALKSSAVEVALAVLNRPNCGLECRTTPEDGRYFLNNWAAGIGSTPLMLAAHANRLDVVKELVSRKVNVNVIEGEFGYTALHVAAADGHTEIVEFLVTTARANISILSKSGKSVAFFFETIGKQKNPSSDYFRVSNLLQ